MLRDLNLTNPNNYRSIQDVLLMAAEALIEVD
jgi:hypothetical protein